ncbi:uncharacterized protein LOC117224331 [Megalopta genalis]|uniref:uncharacterized protein LOC117224331 n=1 Tax=Megalopta genalis TaxID=115081 RepID=UPI0014430968|nr:uncharacterized protein LOC117224331 [Megalopta genalis]
MLKTLVIAGLFGSICCGALTNAARTANSFDTQKLYPVASRTFPGFNDIFADFQRKSYYTGQATQTSMAPAYYPIFDPLSVLASLAFLAFLLQSIASLYDHSRSLSSTTVTARQFMEVEMLTLVTQALHALAKYDKSHKGKLSANAKRGANKTV